MSDVVFRFLKVLLLFVQVGLPVLAAAYFILLEKNQKTRLIGLVSSFAVFAALTFVFSSIQWDQVQDSLNGDDPVSGYAKRMQAKEAKLDPAREHDALSKRAETLSSKMFVTYNASKSTTDRAILDQADIDLASLRWEYLFDKFPADQYAELLGDLESLTTNRTLTKDEAAQWTAKFTAFGSANMSQQARKRLEAKVGTGFEEKLKAIPPIDDGILAFNRNVEALLLAQKFDELEAMANDLRQTDARFIGGHKKLAYFYSAIGALKGESCGCGGSYESAASFEEKDDAIKKWMAAYPQSVTARIAISQLAVTHAWKARGHGYAGTVEPEQWKLYTDRMHEAEVFLHDIDPKTEAQVFWIRANTAHASDNPREALDAVYAEAIKDFPHDFGFYANRADALQQKWYGEPGELSTYTQSLLQVPGGDDGLIAYSFVAEDLAQQIKRQDVFLTTGLIWPLVKQAFALREKLYGLGDREWNILFTLACGANDRDYAAMVLNHIGQNWDKAIWHDKFNFDTAVAWIYDK